MIDDRVIDSLDMEIEDLESEAKDNRKESNWLKKTIRIQTLALTTALKELGRRGRGDAETTAAIKQVREALERVTG